MEILVAFVLIDAFIFIASLTGCVLALTWKEFQK